MKKKLGYTLAEVLIALGIVGFISAIMLPVVNRIKPDPVKVMFITTYDAITNATHDLAANTGVYNIIDGNGRYQFDKAPLQNIEEVDIGGKTYGGTDAKYCEMLGLSLNIIGDMTCSDVPVTYSDATFANNISFTGTNGVQYLVSTERSLASSNTYYRSDVYIDVNGPEGKNCLYNSSTCKDPDRYHIAIAPNGTVLPADKIGTNHLKNRTDFTKRKTQATNVEEMDNELLTIRPTRLTGTECEILISSGGACSGKINVASKSSSNTNYSGATSYCAQNGGRLPTLNELLSLAKKYSEGDTTVKNELSAGTYWTSTEYSNSNYMYTGNVGSNFEIQTTGAGGSVGTSMKYYSGAKALCIE